MNKKCCICKEIKSLDMFYRNKTKKDRLQTYCKDCAKEYDREYHKKFNHKIREYRLKNKDKMKEYNADYILKNKDKVKRQRKKFRLENKDKLREVNKEYYLKNKDKMREHHKEYQIEYGLKNKYKIKRQGKKGREILDDNYVKRLLTSNNNLSFNNIPQWLIKAKRQELQLKRHLKDIDD